MTDITAGEMLNQLSGAINERACGKCEVEKPLAEFYPKGDALSSWCKDCCYTADQCEVHQHIPIAIRGLLPSYGLFKGMVNFGEEALPGLAGISGVYLLRDDEHNVLYIGQSKNLQTRLATHEVECSSFSIITAPAENLDLLEAVMLYKYQPELSRYAPLSLSVVAYQMQHYPDAWKRYAVAVVWAQQGRNL